MGTVHHLPAATAGVTLRQAADAFLAYGTSSPNTRRAYASKLGRMAAEFGEHTPAAAIGPERFAAWFSSQWGGQSAASWNVALATFRSAASYWTAQGWTAGDPSRLLSRRPSSRDRSRALSRAEVDRLLTDDRYPLRERALWRLLYETAARASEVLGLDVADLDLPNRRAKVTRKGGAVDVIVWQTGSARLLPRLLKGRTSGPVFLTERRARVELPPGDTDPASGKARLSYDQAEALFKAASGGATLHQLRHSALTHAAEDGASAPMLMAKSGHQSVRSLAISARVSPEALARYQAEHDPARRR